MRCDGQSGDRDSGFGEPGTQGTRGTAGMSSAVPRRTCHARVQRINPKFRDKAGPAGPSRDEGDARVMESTLTFGEHS